MALPIGPMGILCIQQTLAFGLAAGLAIGFAAATVHVIYGTVAAIGLGSAAEAWVGTGATLLPIVGALVLFWMALGMVRREVPLNPRVEVERRRVLRSYAGALVVAFGNPLTPLLFFAALPALTTSTDATLAPVLVGGVFVGSAGWYCTLTALVALLRDRLSTRALEVTNIVAGCLLAGLGAWMLVGAGRAIFA